MNINPYKFSPFTIFKLIECEQHILKQYNKGWLGDINKGWFKYLFIEAESGDILICKPIEEIPGILVLSSGFQRNDIKDILAFKLCNN